MGISVKNLSTGEVAELPPELYWLDEFDWIPVKGSHKRGCAGSLIVVQSIAQGGRPITIGAKSDMDWTPRHLVETLRNWSATLGTKVEVKITYPSSETILTAMFNTVEKPVEATPLSEYASPKPTDEFHLKINLIEVAQ